MENIWVQIETTTFAFDTSALNPKTNNWKILEVATELRAFIPWQVTHETVDVWQRVQQKKLSKISKDIALLKSLKGGEKKSDGTVKALKVAIESCEDDLRKKRKNSQESLAQLRKLFLELNAPTKPKDNVLLQRAAMARLRFDCRIPPGFADESKDDNAIGDALIWFEILERAESLGNLVLVTDDAKDDWQIFGSAHPSLVDEYADHSNGKKFTTMSSQDFMKLVQSHQPNKVTDVEVEAYGQNEPTPEPNDAFLRAIAAILLKSLERSSTPPTEKQKQVLAQHGLLDRLQDFKE